MKEKVYAFLSRKVNMENAIVACMVTFLVTVALTVLWLTVLAGSFGNMVNTVKFAQMMYVLDRVYIGETDTEEVSDYVFSEMVNLLGDRWSYYMTKEVYEQYQQVQSNHYTGIGVTLQKDETGWLIVDVADSSPAQNAGICVDTYLVEVNEVAVSDMETGEMGDCVVCQTRNSLKNMVAILEEAGMTTDNIVKTTIFLDDMGNFGAVNEVYAQFFGEAFPARSCVQVAALPKAAKVEIEAVACK